MALLGERVPAAEGRCDWGLINRVVPDDEFEAARRGAGSTGFAAGPTRSYAGTKRQLNRWLYAGMDEQLELEADIQQEMAASADFVEGVMAFVREARARVRRALTRTAARAADRPADYNPRRFAHRPLRLRRRLLLALLLARWSRSLAARRRRLRGLLDARERRLAERRRHRHALQDRSSSLAVVVFVGVEGALLYSLIKFRARKGAVPAQIRGNTRLEIGWTRRRRA